MSFRLATAWPADRVAALLVPCAESLPPAPTAEPVTLRALEERARTTLGEPWPAPRARDYARYFRSGDRDAYERLVFDHDRRLTRAAVLAAATGDQVWLDEAADGVVLLCERSTWCWPAHDDTFARHGTVLPRVDDPYLDLGAGEVAGQLAWLDHLVGDELDRRTPGVRARLRYEVERRVLVPFETRRDWHWLGRPGDVHNWNPWIHGNVLVAALRLVDDPDRRARLVALVLDGLDRYAASLPADGAIDEGYAYWWNGACRLLEALDLLDHATGGGLGGAPFEALRATVAFLPRVHLGGDWYVNHADGPAKSASDLPWQALHQAARRVGDREAESHAAAHRRPGEPVAHESQGLGRLLRALADREWAAATPTASAPPRDVWFPSTQVLVARSGTGLTLVAKGGHNGEHHNHNDVGSVLVATGGVPVLVDPGRPTYTRQTFSADRYAIWTMRSGWHNTPTIRGTEQHDGRTYAAGEVTPSVRDTASSLTLDLAGAYPRTDVRRWRREARLDRATGVIVIRDDWELDPDEAAEPTWIHLVLAGTVRLGDGHAEIDALEGAGTVRVSWEPGGVPATVTVRDLDDPMLREVWGDRLTRLDIDVTALGPIGTLRLSVKEQR